MISSSQDVDVIRAFTSHLTELKPGLFPSIINQRGACPHPLICVISQDPGQELVAPWFLPSGNMQKPLGWSAAWGRIAPSGIRNSNNHLPRETRSGGDFGDYPGPETLLIFSPLWWRDKDQRANIYSLRSHCSIMSKLGRGCLQRVLGLQNFHILMNLQPSSWMK